MRIFGKHIYPRQIIVFASGVLFLATTTYDVHRSIKNNKRLLHQSSSKLLKITSTPSAARLRDGVDHGKFLIFFVFVFLFFFFFFF
ncbi:hypothetical protein Pfo_003513 [Paulownia fortunei]|nr:hypothetical protein Pfo_003513 [Paulownia fortunei]